MFRRFALILVLTTLVEWGAFRFLHRDLLWIDLPAAASAPVAMTRETAQAAFSRHRLSRRHTEALVRATDRDGLRDLHVAALHRLVGDHPGDAAILLRYAEALRREGRLAEAEIAFTRVAEAP
jgi:hypothetical protein